MSHALEALIERTRARWAPPVNLPLSDWADRYRMLSSASSAEPGRWKTSRTPYMREPMDALSDRHTEAVVIMSSAQTGKSELMINFVGYNIHVNPGPMMYLMPTLDMAAAVSKDRLRPLFQAMPELQAAVGATKTRSASSTILHTAFNGGSLTLAGANSPSSLASRPIRTLLCDEVDRWPSDAGGEGDPLQLAWKRTATYRSRKVVIASTPTIKDASRIEAWYLVSDQREYRTPCPRCGEAFTFEWEHIRFEDRQPDTAYIECPHCQGRIEERERLPMVAKGEWVATAPFTGIRGYRMWEGFSPWRTIHDIVAAFLVARQSLESRQTFVNTSLGRVWEVPGQRVESSSLLVRRETYAAELPAGVKVLTMGVDVQDDRLEALVIGWGEGEEAWVIHGETLIGNPAGPEVWSELDELLATKFAHENGGSLSISATLVDGGGHKTQGVYDAVIPRQKYNVWVCFGRDGGESGLLVSPPKAIKTRGGGSVLRRIVDVSQAKSLIYGRLKAIEEPGPEFIHFPAHLGETFFDQLTAEKLVTSRNKFGVPSKRWVQVRERNEALDTFVYALGALRAIAPTPDKFRQAAGTLELTRLRKSA